MTVYIRITINIFFTYYNTCMGNPFRTTATIFLFMNLSSNFPLWVGIKIFVLIHSGWG